MKNCALLSLLLALGCVHVRGAPVEQAAMEQGSCEDASALGAARLALTKINQERKEGYVFSLHRLSNVHTTSHGENGVVFYLTLDVVETNCSVLSKRDWKACEIRPTENTPVYGQCKAAIFINKVQRVVRLYKYDCVIRPVPSANVTEICPDCPTPVALNNAMVEKIASLSLEKFNKESRLSKRFALLKIERATSGMAMEMYYNVEYSIQETTCTKSTGAVKADECPLMDCEFAHKGFCQASLFHTPMGEGEPSVECEIFEPEAAEREKKLHEADTDHSHNDTQTHDHDHAASSSHRHAHDHSHDHGHGHDHVHAHHAKAHDHTGDSHNHHHHYKHADGKHTHEHDHEIALDHDHKHAHLHEHEHHHHHHDHDHKTTAHDQPEGMVRVLPSMDQPMTLPAFPDVPAGGPEVGVTLPLKPDPQIPGEMEPTIQVFPTSVSAQCAAPAAGQTMVEKAFAEDPMFKPAA